MNLEKTKGYKNGQKVVIIEALARAVTSAITILDSPF